MLWTGDGMTVYLDQVWMLNSVVDYLLLSLSGQLLGQPRHRIRLILAGAAGGIYAALSLLPGFRFLQGTVARILCAGLLCYGAFGRARGILRQTAVLFLLAAAFSRAQATMPLLASTWVTDAPAARHASVAPPV